MAIGNLNVELGNLSVALRILDRHKLINNAQRTRESFNKAGGPQNKVWRLGFFGFAPKLGTKCMALKVSEKAASHPTPPHAPTFDPVFRIKPNKYFLFDDFRNEIMP